MVRRWPISLEQLKAGNNSEKLKNEITQLLYSWYRSENFANQFYKSLSDIIWKWKQSLWTLKIVKKSEPDRFKLDLTDKLNLKNTNKNMALANWSIAT